VTQTRVVALLSLAACVGLSGCTSLYFRDAGAPPPEVPRYALTAWPYAEYWTGIIFNGEKVGYAHVAVAPAPGHPGRYEIRSESTLHIRLLGFDKHIALESTDRVNDDLTLEWFSHRYDLDGNRLELVGGTSHGTLNARVTNAGRTTELALPLDGPVHPASAVGLLPVQRGLRIGAEYRYLVFSGQTQSIAPVVQRVEAYERSELFAEPGFRVASGFLGLESTTWFSPRGLPLLELGLRGVIISALSTEERAKSFIARTAINKDESLIGFSLVKLDVPLAEPRAKRRLEVALSGPAPLETVPSDPLQQCRRAQEELICTVQSDAAWPTPDAPPDLKRHLGPSLAVPADDDRIRALAREIAPERREPRAQVDALRAWLRANIRKEPADAFSALDVLRTRAAECQGHAFLYAALARALGIPTRVANGVVYSEEFGGFLYHAWNESWVGDRWLSVDTTLDQQPADATHIKLVYGEEIRELVALAGWVGKLKLRVLDQE
jgi:hypothetical protein